MGFLLIFVLALPVCIVVALCFTAFPSKSTQDQQRRMAQLKQFELDRRLREMDNSKKQ